MGTVLGQIWWREVPAFKRGDVKPAIQMKKPGLAFALLSRAFSVSDPEEEELSEALDAQVTDVAGGRLCSITQDTGRADHWRWREDGRQQRRGGGELVTLTTEDNCP